MNPRELVFGINARKKIMRGVELVSRAVGTTLGPKGRNVALSSKYAGVIVVHDGVTVAKEIRLKDRLSNVGAMLVRQAAARTNEDAGDGTTTSTILAYEIAREGMKMVEAGANPMFLRRGIEIAVKQAVESLKKQAEPVKTLEKKIQVATVSAADEEIGREIAQALEKVGEYGVVTATKGTEPGYVTKVKDGMEWDKGWHLPHFPTFLPPDKDKPNFRGEAVVRNPYILITDHTISSTRQIVPLLNTFISEGKKDLLIISDGVEREALGLLILNLQKGLLNVLAVSAPSFGNHKRDGLEDIAILTGGTFISQEEGRKIESVKIEELGRADEVISTIESTVLIGGKGNKEKVKVRAGIIRKQMEDSKHEYEKERYEERLAKLTAGVAVVEVGAATEEEAREKIERVKDAIGATKAAQDEGIVPGGGVALLTASKEIDMKDVHDEEELQGMKIVKRALQYPTKLLAENAGSSGEVVVENILKKQKGIGYNVSLGEYVDMIKTGIIDPVKVTISALQNAASIATMILTTEVMVVEDDSEEKKQNG